MLQEQQQHLMAYLRNEESQISEHIADQGGINVELRLGIYHNAYRMRLRESIEVDHPVLGIYLGDDLFDLMATEYIKYCPSQRTSLRHFADQLPGFLGRQAPFSEHGQITELARFERLLMTAFDAGEANRLATNKLSALPIQDWPNTTMRFHPSMQIFNTTWNVVEIWQAIREEREPPPPVESTNHWLVWRNSQRLTQFASLSALENQLLKNALEGKNLAELCDTLTTQMEESTVAEKFLLVIKSWFDKGIVSALYQKG